MNNRLSERLRILLRGRKKHPWAASLGISRGTADRMFRGEIPGHETLGLIMRAENISISWLTEGAGAPYLVRWFTTDEEALKYLDELLELQDWTVHRLTDGEKIDVLILYAPAEVEYKGTTVRYTEINVIAGVSLRVVARLAELPSHRLTHASTAVVAAVGSGVEAGTWRLLHDRNALLRTYKKVRASELTDAGYLEGEQDAERSWLGLYHRLDPDNRARLRELGDAIAGSGAAEDTTDEGQDSDRIHPRRRGR